MRRFGVHRRSIMYDDVEVNGIYLTGKTTDIYYSVSYFYMIFYT